MLEDVVRAQAGDRLPGWIRKRRAFGGVRGIKLASEEEEKCCCQQSNITPSNRGKGKQPSHGPEVRAEHWIDKADLRRLSQGCEDCNLSGRLLSSYKIAFQGAKRVHCPGNRETKSNANLLCYVTNMLSDT